MVKKIVAAALCLCLLGSFILSAAAEQTDASSRTIRIVTEEQFLAFAQNCILDSYSLGLTVSLQMDLDLTGTDFQSIPIFGGTFLGNGHTISGLTVTYDGSYQGLFRHLTHTALVQDLTVEADIQPQGSRLAVGGIAGENSGRIIGCTVRASVSGSDMVGGIAGRNAVTGIIENCRMEGNIHGDHFVGGIAGENYGVIRACVNMASVNTTPKENQVGISDITLNSLTNSESANTVTDIGGIAGISTGVIRQCQNRGDVGYTSMGYNIGGIAGTQSGYLVDCVNYGAVSGRKEVGGIVGQMEPAAVIEYAEDTLQILEGQLDTMSGMVNRASSNASANAQNMGGYMGVLYDQATIAAEAADAMASGLVQGDRDSFLAAQSTLSSVLSDIPNTLQGLSYYASKTVNTLTRDLRAISGQITAMGKTIRNAPDNLGGTFVDISDKDTELDLTGKVTDCQNFGPVTGDLNVGGIAGAMAMENDMDFWEDWETQGEDSMNFTSEIRAVVLICSNEGTVTAKKQNGGGICGWQSMGLIRLGTNTGMIDCPGAAYIGGISGMSTGFIRTSYSKCPIWADSYVGGIAGSGSTVTGCISMVTISDAREKAGAILGWQEAAESEDAEFPVFGNVYPVVDQDIGGIDGISYAGIAQSVSMDSFVTDLLVPPVFRSVIWRFIQDDGSIVQLRLTPGSSLPEDMVPQVQEKAGHTGCWEGLKEEDLVNITLDKTWRAAYTAYILTIASQEVSPEGQSLVLLEGSFPEGGSVTLTEVTGQSIDGEAPAAIWQMEIPEGTTAIRLRVPDKEKSYNLFILDAQGSWQPQEATQDGSYLVFAPTGQSMCVALTEQAGVPVVLYGGIGAAAVIGLWILLKRKKK